MTTKRRAKRNALIGLLAMAASIIGVVVAIKVSGWAEQQADINTIKAVLTVVVGAVCYYGAFIFTFSNITKLESITAEQSAQEPHSK